MVIGTFLSSLGRITTEYYWSLITCIFDMYTARLLIFYCVSPQIGEYNKNGISSTHWDFFNLSTHVLCCALRNAHLFDALISYALKTVNSSECNSRINKTEKKNKAEKKNDNNQSEKYRITTFTYAFEKKLISIIRLNLPILWAFTVFVFQRQITFAYLNYKISVAQSVFASWCLRTDIFSKVLVRVELKKMFNWFRIFIEFQQNKIISVTFTFLFAKK